MEKFNVLLAYEEPHMLKAAFSGLEEKGFAVDRASSENEVIQLLDERRYDVVITSVLGEPKKRNAVLKIAKERNPDTIIVLLGAAEDPRCNYDTLSYGAADYIFSPCGTTELWERIEDCLEKAELKKRDEHYLELMKKFKIQISNISESISKGIKGELESLAEEITKLRNGLSGKIDNRDAENMERILDHVGWLIKQTDSLSKGFIPEQKFRRKKSDFDYDD